jgi:dolichol-phosphate mannosyltransferase
LPITLISDPTRKGYSRAVTDGLRATTAGLVACVDADGQCDPRDLARLVDALNGHDLVVGRRVHRADHWSRMVMSRAFRLVFSAFFKVPLQDPSSPYLLITRPGLERVLASDPGILPQGFWWEFYARAAEMGLELSEIPVGHRPRSAGRTQVYRPSKIPRIALVHLIGLVRLRRELRSHRP